MLHDDLHFLLAQPLSLRGLHRVPVDGRAFDLGALHSEHRFVGGRIAAHDLELGAEHSIEQRRNDLGEIARPGAGHRRLVALGILDRLHLRGVPHDVNGVTGGEAADPDELGGIVLHGGVLERLLDRERLADDAERSAVLRRHIGDVVGGAQRAGARHVLRYDRRIAGKMASEMACNQAAHQVVGAAGRVADIDGDSLANELLRAGRRDAGEHEGDERKLEPSEHCLAGLLHWRPSDGGSERRRTFASQRRDDLVTDARDLVKRRHEFQEQELDA